MSLCLNRKGMFIKWQKNLFFIIIDDEMPTQPLVTANEADEDEDMDATQPAHVNQAID